MYWGSIASGVTQGLEAVAEQKRQAMRDRAQQFLMDQQTAAAQADASGADALTAYLAQLAQPSPQPGQSSQPMQPPRSPTGGGPVIPPMPKIQDPMPQGNPGQPGVMPGAAGSPAGPAPSRAAPTTMAAFGGQPQVRPMGPQAAPQGIAPPPPRPYQDPMQMPAQGQIVPQMGQIPPPPAMPVPDPAKLPPPAQMAAELKKQGVKPQAIMAALKSYMPMYEAAQRDQIKDMEVQLRAQEAGQRAALQVLLESGRNNRFQQKEEDLAPSRDARIKQGDRALDIKEEMAQTAKSKEARLRSAASGGAALSAEDTQFWADYVRNGGALPAGLGRGAQGGKTVQAIMHQVASGAGAIDPIDMLDNKNAQTGASAAARTAGTSSARMAIAATEALGAFDLAEQVSGKVPRSQFKGLNSALLSFEKGTGSPEAGSFEAAVNTAVNTYAKAINPSGTATVSDKEHAREILSTADSPEAFKARLAVLRQEVERARKAPQSVAEDLRKGKKAGSSSKVVDWSDLK